MKTENQVFIVEPGAGSPFDLGGLGVQFKVLGDSTEDRLSVMEHPMEPGRLIPPHVHEDQDELSYVLEGTFGVRVGDRVGTAGPGSYFFKPRGVPHTFWNAGPAPARLIEIVWPSGCEHFFEALAELPGSVSGPDELDARLKELARRHRTRYLPEWIPELKSRFDLRVLGEP